MYLEIKWSKALVVIISLSAPVSIKAKDFRLAKGNNNNEHFLLFHFYFLPLRKLV